MKTITLPDMMSINPLPNCPFFMDLNMFDITNTIISALNNLPDNCIGVSIRSEVGKETRKQAIRLAKEKKHNN